MTKNSEFTFCCVTKVHYFGCEPLLESFESTYVDLYCLNSPTLFLFSEWKRNLSSCSCPKGFEYFRTMPAVVIFRN